MLYKVRWGSPCPIYWTKCFRSEYFKWQKGLLPNNVNAAESSTWYTCNVTYYFNIYHSRTTRTDFTLNIITLLKCLQFVQMTASSEGVNFLYFTCTPSLASSSFCSCVGTCVNFVSTQWDSGTWNGTIICILPSFWKKIRNFKLITKQLISKFT